MRWLTALHIIAFAAWMAGMWYLPRLLVYHSGASAGSELSETLKVMERRLLRVIATPAMLVTLTVGFLLASWTGAWTEGWLHAKLLLVSGMAAVHGLLAREIRGFAADERRRGAHFYRVLNEIPTVLFIMIVVLAVVRPF